MVVTRIAAMVVRAGGLVMLILGALFWTGNARNLVSAHMLLGMLVVVALWLLALLAVAAGRANAGPSAAAFVTGVLVLLVGMTQTRLLVGPAHWVIQVAHLLLGVVAIGLGEVLGGRLTRAHRAKRAPLAAASASRVP